jgi:MFS family permease
MTIGTFISSLMVGPLSTKFGRKRGLFAATILNYIATSIQLGTTSKAALYVARLILGGYPSLVATQMIDMPQVFRSDGF